jgi:pSer/pThr/pTyr-binding forkhead associated (FHA) protein
VAQTGLVLGMDNMEDVSTENNENSGTEISIPEDFFLISQGVKAIPLNQSVISIGRGHDNIAVIDDPRISRHHAEIRVIQDRFVFFDLDSSGGSFINDQRVNQGLLYPGDIISLAGVKLVFVFNKQLPTRNRTDTTFIGPGVHPTAIFHSSKTDKDKKKKDP